MRRLGRPPRPARAGGARPQPGGLPHRLAAATAARGHSGCEARRRLAVPLGPRDTWHCGSKACRQACAARGHSGCDTRDSFRVRWTGGWLVWPRHTQHRRNKACMRAASIMCRVRVPSNPAGAIEHWPALSRWRDLSYLLRVAGGRTVPVEVRQRTTQPRACDTARHASACADRLVPARSLHAAPCALNRSRVSFMRVLYCVVECRWTGGGALPGRGLGPAAHDPARLPRHPRDSGPGAISPYGGERDRWPT